MPLLECVPNVSEGQRADVIDRLIERSLETGMRLIDRTSDVDHNRTVLTWIGEPLPLMRASVELVRVAREEIDIADHRGVHPFVGAVDVLPFVPLDDVDMPVAVETAKQTASAIADELQVPTFLYEHAATAPERRHLARHRRGGLSALSKRIEQGTWRPDYGPSRLDPRAGAVLVGARNVLIAWNVVLETADGSVARAHRTAHP